MQSNVLPASPAHKLSALEALFYAVAATAALPGAAVAFTAPPPIAEACSAGSWSRTGRAPCNTASLGHYVPTSGARSQTPAPLGRYVDTVGASAAKTAPLGSYVDTVGASAPKLAPLGRYVDTVGASAAKAASLGSYVDTVGASAAKLAPLGRYVDTLGASAAKLAPAGSYVDTVGAKAAKLAPVGYYVVSTGQAAAVAAPVGTFAAGLGNVAAAACPGGTNAYGAASACRIVAPDYVGPGVRPLLTSSFSAGGSNDLGPVNAGDGFSFQVVNASADKANDSRLTGLTLLSYSFSDPTWFQLVGFTPGMELAADGGLTTFSLQAQAGLPAGAFAFTLTLNTDQNADYQAPGQSFVYSFSGFHAAVVPEPGAAALLLAGLLSLGGLARRQRAGRNSAPACTANS